LNKKNKNLTILISGSTGFLGSYLLESFLGSGYKVIALKRADSDTYRINDYSSRVTLYDIDSITLAEVFRKHKIDIVINTVTNYGRKDTNITSIVNTNVVFGLKLLEESINNNVIAFINTDTLLEKNVNSYALSKAQLVDWMKFLSNKNTKMVNIKIEHMYGPKDDKNKLIYWLIGKLKQNVKSIDLTSGIQKRDFIYIDDVISAYEIIIKNIDHLLKYEEFELGSGKSIEVRNFIENIYRKFSKGGDTCTQLNFGVVPYRENENMNMVANTEKLNNLGWKPKFSIQDGINKIIK
jgi:CDP-paratose synthetase